MPLLAAIFSGIGIFGAYVSGVIIMSVDGGVFFSQMQANVEQCEAAVEQSLSMITSLNPHIGYEKAAALAKEAFQSGKTIRELVREQGIVAEATLRETLDPMSMTEPQE